MNENTRQILARVVRNVLERFTFMFTDEADEEAANVWTGEYLHTVITFQGATNGALSLTAPMPLCSGMAANILGLDSGETSPEMAADALRELANIICGELVVALFGDKAVFDLTVPALYRVDLGKWRELSADSDNLQFMVDDTPVLVGLHLLM
jgi:CheY-specific phosphatase CheX